MKDQNLSKNKQAPIILIIGKRGSGKTVLLKKITQKLDRIIYIDPIGEFLDSKDGVIIQDYNSLVIYLARGLKKFRIFYQIEDEEDFNKIIHVCEIVKNLTLAVDEVDIFFPVHGMSAEASRLVKRGRHKGLSIVGTTRRCAEVSKMLTSQASVIIVFKMHEPRDIQYLSSFIGERVKEVKNLKDFKFLTWTS